MVFFLAFFTLAGYNFSFWMMVGFIRFLLEKFPIKKPKKRGRPSIKLSPKDVAAIIPAHNEELSINETVEALKKVMPTKNIYVASDFSTDNTVTIARNLGVEVLDIKPNIGKARAIVRVLRHYRLLKKYRAILINDADVTIDANYLKRALPIFNENKKIVAIAPHGISRWKNYNFWETFFIAYRTRLWRIIQLGMRFGQTWKFTNVSFIVPGSLCLYRSKALSKIKIYAKGLIIEDFNMTFELQKKHLGKIYYSPNIFGIHQDPYNLKDYIKQVKRWDLGFWQTVKKNGIWPSLFWLATGSFILELLAYSLFLLLLPLILVIFFLNSFQPLTIPLLNSKLLAGDVLLGVIAIDYATTAITVMLEKKPILLLYGFGFIFLRILDAFLYLYTIPLAFIVKSYGTWASPKRK